MHTINEEMLISLKKVIEPQINITESREAGLGFSFSYIEN